MKVLCTGFKGKNNSSYYLLSKISGQKLFLTNSYDDLKKDIMNVTDKYDLVVMFGLDTSLKNTANFLCKLLIEANAGKVERAIEEAAARCVEDGEYIAEPEEIEKVEEPVNIRRRRAR